MQVTTPFCTKNDAFALSGIRRLRKCAIKPLIMNGEDSVLDTVEDKGLEAVGSQCPLLEELRVFPADPFDPQSGVSESGLVAVSNGCPKLHYILYCHRMTNAAIVAIDQNCPDFTHFCLCIMKPHEPDYL